MKTKEKVIEAAHDLPEDASIEDAMERLFLISKIEKGIEQADSGQTISHAQVREKLKLKTGEPSMVRRSVRGKKMKWSNAILTALVVLCALWCSARNETNSPAILAYTNMPPAEGDKQWPLHEDEMVKMVAVGYGDATHQSNPGFYVFRKKTKDWIRIDKVPTRGATFGRSPTMAEVKAEGKTPASIGWDFRSLAEKPEVDFPLKAAGFLFFPDKMERNEKQKVYVLHFNSGWEIKGVETILRLRIDELMKTDLEQSPGGDSLKAASQE